LKSAFFYFFINVNKPNNLVYNLIIQIGYFVNKLSYQINLNINKFLLKLLLKNPKFIFLKIFFLMFKNTTSYKLTLHSFLLFIYYKTLVLTNVYKSIN